MGDKTRIEWCDATWNPVTGCTKLSAGCKFCYARAWLVNVMLGSRRGDVLELFAGTAPVSRRVGEFIYYEVLHAVLYHSKQSKEQLERGEFPKSVLLTKPTTIVAVSEREVAMIGARERGGKVKAATISDTGKENLHKFIKNNVVIGSTLYTDSHQSYLGLDDYKHESANRSVAEYVRGMAHTNGIESFWALLKRGYFGVFHQFSWKHLQRYLAEFEARWNMADAGGDVRMDLLLESVVGSRLTYEALTA